MATVIFTLLITAIFFAIIVFVIFKFGHNETAVANLASNRDLRGAARNALAGKWGGAALVVLVYLPFWILQGLPNVGFIFYLLLYGIFAFGWSNYSLKLVRHDDASVGDFFAGFNEFGRCLGAGLLVTIYVFLWALLLIIPGMLAGLSYAMTFYILADHPEMKANDAIGLSRKLMEGRRWKLFCLAFGFCGWFILVALTFGIAIFWVLPYLMATMASFYEDIKHEDQLGIEKATANTKNASPKSVNANNNNETAPAPIKPPSENKITSIEKNDEAIDLARYKQAAGEVETSNRDDALWYKAFAEGGGDENATKAAYIRLRVEQLRRAAVAASAVRVTATQPSPVYTPAPPTPARPKPKGANTLYDILGIARKSTDEEILAGYQTQKSILDARENQDAETRNRLIFLQHAKEVLLDPIKRAAYDARI